MAQYKIITESNEETVVSEYKSATTRSDAFQSEAALEKEFIHMLQEQSYEYLSIHNEKDLIDNLRKQLSLLNNYDFTDKEWNALFNGVIANPNNGIPEKTQIIQEDSTQPIIKESDGLTKNIKLIDKENIHNNRLQVINQYEVEDGKHKNRYDVTILVNGLPLVHVELKRRGAEIKEAFNQIERYQRDSFWAGSGLYEYIQIFVISNGANTKYYSNTTRFNHIKSLAKEDSKKSKTSNSFEFTSHWATAENKILPDLVDFTRTFFSKHTLLNVLTRYCVFTSEKLLLVMRPYQIVATERIIKRIEIATNYKKYGSIDAGGYIWHTTGSGKTLTSFKTARLASAMEGIDKVLFVVDRRDLDYQTMREYDRFEKGAANSNKSTAVLKKQLEDPDCHILITTIQKLSVFVEKNPKHDIYDKKVVIIFDECHRSQFGQMHRDIVKSFKKYYIFGFTGTPIFTDNAVKGNKNLDLKTTKDAFGDNLHTYTIVDAISDGNVLPFRIDYISTVKTKEIDDEDVHDIDRDSVYNAPERITNVVEYILKHFNQKTYRNEKTYSFSALKNINEVANSKKDVEEIKVKTQLKGFNSIFATSSIEAAKLYYTEFRKQMAENPNKALKIAIIYSYGANEEEPDGIIEEENPEDTSKLDKSSRDFLEEAIGHYNTMFNTNYSTDSDGFQRYYKDVSLRMKNRELDILIVVDMFLTGFDATTLNTLWVDKKLKMHGLIQAFSRTNRILNSIKRFGNIVCFRNLQKRTDEAIARFGDTDTKGLIIIRSFNDYYYGFNDKTGKHHKGYKELIEELVAQFPLSEPKIIGEEKQKSFLILFGAILRTRNLLSSFDEFEGNEILPEIDFQDYTSRYLDLRPAKVELVDIKDDVVYEMELLNNIDVNIDYILMLIDKYKGVHGKDDEILIKIKKTLGSSPNLRSKRELIINFINGINDVEDILAEWHKFIAEQKENDLQEIIKTEKLKETETKTFIHNAFRDGYVKTNGVDVDKIMPPISRFGGSKREEIKRRIIEKLTNFFSKYYGLVDFMDED